MRTRRDGTWSSRKASIRERSCHSRDAATLSYLSKFLSLLTNDTPRTGPGKQLGDHCVCPRPSTQPIQTIRHPFANGPPCPAAEKCSSVHQSRRAVDFLAASAAPGTRRELAAAESTLNPAEEGKEKKKIDGLLCTIDPHSRPCRCASQKGFDRFNGYNNRVTIHMPLFSGLQ